MKKPNITEGPWHLNKDEIQAFKTSNVYAGDGVVMLGSSELKESVANARLIAAAPAMAEALEIALKSNSNNFMEMKFRAQAALTLAGYEF